MRLDPVEVTAERLADGTAIGDFCEDPITTVVGFLRERDAQIRAVLGFALAHADPFPLLRALAADLGGEDHSPPTLPGPTEHATVLLRYRYYRHADGGGYLGADKGEPTYGFPLAVAGARVCVHYSHAEADGVAALAEEERMKGRLYDAGARSVEMVGEVERT